MYISIRQYLYYYYHKSSFLTNPAFYNMYYNRYWVTIERVYTHFKAYALAYEFNAKQD